MLIVSNYNVQPECVLAFDGNTTKNVYSGLINWIMARKLIPFPLVTKNLLEVEAV